MIRLEHICKTFGEENGGVHAVRDVSLHIRQGEIFGIIGFSGAGKIHAGALHQPAGAAHQRHRHGGRSGADGPFGKGAAAGSEEDQHDLPELQPADAADRA